jgi:hypothetical protein
MVVSGRRVRLFAVGLALTLGVAACGGGGSGGGGVASLSNGGGNASGSSANTGTSTQDFRAQMLDYAKCMRANGVDFPDPQFDANGRPQFDRNSGGQGFDSLRNSPNFQKARKACESKRPHFGGQFQLTPQQQAEARKSLLAFATCMRDHGVDFPDPTFDANGRPQFDGNGGGRRAFDNSDPKVTEARDACRRQAGGSFGRGPGGFGPPGGRPGGNGDSGSNGTTT